MLAELATIVRNICRTPSDGDEAATFQVLTNPNPAQARALELVKAIKV